MNINKFFETGTIYSKLTKTKSDSIDFIPHKTFKGVFLKHLVKGEETDNQISCHLVEIKPNCALETHIHSYSIEIHEVIYGYDNCKIEKNKLNTLLEI